MRYLRKGPLRLPIWALSVSACSFAVNAGAQLPGRLSCYRAEFFLEPIKITEASVWIPEDSPIFETRLLPQELWEVVEPVEANGAVLLRSGDQLVTMRSQIPTKCNFPLLKYSGIAARQRICVFDTDGDGVFDKIFSRSRGGDIWFAMSWQHPKDGMLDIVPIKIKKIDPTQFRGGPSVKYNTYHIPLRRHPHDGSAPYYEAFTEAKLYGTDGLSWRMDLTSNYAGRVLLGGDVVRFEGLSIKVEEVAAEKARISYSGNFWHKVIELPFINSYENKCDIKSSRAF